MHTTLVAFSFASVLLAGSLRDCASLTRFEQESYDCSATQAPFNKLTFQDIAIGEGGVIDGAEPTRATISQYGGDRLIVEWGRDRLVINRKTGGVTVTRNGVLRSYACKRAQFQM
ncbi:hypothetical protein PM03_09480 [Thalassobacter stenotrophicus]|jgi:hypothetical protein|uniref:hypothetical protein n=1 Tax=Thalassobacter TaxID=266808 RepID=UPI00051DD194|nr:MULTISPECIES: hypothetical protein [Thalassobacter]KGK79704.1 hypothetical protein PM03_09480 [Thalassobacter stenotrophicus]KGL01685.1 hypothetical protein PM04_07880 [Thalassobacter sp. 16PALIMAR09]